MPSNIRLLRVLTPLGLWLAAAGCGTVYSPDCADILHVVADDDPLPGGITVQEMVASLPAEARVPGTWYDDRVAEVRLTTARGSGAAVWIESEEIQVAERGGLPFTEQWSWVGVICEDRVRFPIDATLSTDDGELDLDLQLTATFRPVPEIHFGLPSAARWDAPPDLEGLPSFDEHFGHETSPDGAPLVPDHSHVFVEFPEDGARGRVGWSGEYPNERDRRSKDDMELAWFERLIEFGESP